MKRLLTVFFLMVSIYGFGQVPSNYLNIRSRYNLIAVKTDSGFHVPGYSTIPNYRGGVWSGAGNIGVDTVNNKFYFYSGGAWREAGSTNYADSLRRSGLSVQMRKNGNWTTQFNLPDSVGGSSLVVGAIDAAGSSTDGAIIRNDTLFMQLFGSEVPGLTPAGGDPAKADTSDMLTIDTTGVQDGDVATWDDANNKVVFEAPTGGSTDSTWHINFKTEVTPGAPNGGDSTFVHPYLEGKVLDIYRDGVRQSILSNQYSITTNTLVFHPPLDSAEVVEIIIKDSTRHRWLLFEDIQEQDIEINSYQGSVTESPNNQWNFSSNTKFAATATKMTGNGYVTLETTGQAIIISLDATTDLEAHTDPFPFNYGFWLYGGQIYVASLGESYVGINIAATNGMTYYKLRRLSGEVKLYGSTDGVTFNLLYTYPDNYSGDLYFKGFNTLGGTGVIINPKSYGFE